MIRKGNAEFLPNDKAAVLVVRNARKGRRLLLVGAEIRFIAIPVGNAHLLDPEVTVVEDRLVVRIDLDELGARMVVRLLRRTLRRRAVVNDDLVRIDFDLLARNVLMRHPALGILDRADARAVVISQLPAVDFGRGLSRRELDEMRFILDCNILREHIALDFIRGHAAIVNLRDLHVAARQELARDLVVEKIVALKGSRQIFRRRIYGLAQMLAHILRILQELLLRLCQPVLLCRAPFVFDIVEDVRRRIRGSAVSRGRRPRQKGCGQQDAKRRLFLAKQKMVQYLHEAFSHPSVVGTAYSTVSFFVWMKSSVPAGSSIFLPLTKAPPMMPIGPRSSMPATLAPAARA